MLYVLVLSPFSLRVKLKWNQLDNIIVYLPKGQHMISQIWEATLLYPAIINFNTWTKIAAILQQYFET